MPGLTAALTRGGGNDATRRLRAISAVFSTTKPLSLSLSSGRSSQHYASRHAPLEEELVAVVGRALAVNSFAPSRALDGPIGRCSAGRLPPSGGFRAACDACDSR